MSDSLFGAIKSIADLSALNGALSAGLEVAIQDVVDPSAKVSVPIRSVPRNAVHSFGKYAVSNSGDYAANIWTTFEQGNGNVECVDTDDFIDAVYDHFFDIMPDLTQETPVFTSSSSEAAVCLLMGSVLLGMFNASCFTAINRIQPGAFAVKHQLGASEKTKLLGHVVSKFSAIITIIGISKLSHFSSNHHFFTSNADRGINSPVGKLVARTFNIQPSEWSSIDKKVVAAIHASLHYNDGRLVLYSMAPIYMQSLFIAHPRITVGARLVDQVKSFRIEWLESIKLRLNTFPAGVHDYVLVKEACRALAACRLCVFYHEYERMLESAAEIIQHGAELYRAGTARQWWFGDRKADDQSEVMSAIRQVKSFLPAAAKIISVTMKSSSMAQSPKVISQAPNCMDDDLNMILRNYEQIKTIKASGILVERMKAIMNVSSGVFKPKEEMLKIVLGDNMAKRITEAADEMAKLKIEEKPDEKTQVPPSAP